MVRARGEQHGEKAGQETEEGLPQARALGMVS